MWGKGCDVDKNVCTRQTLAQTGAEESQPDGQPGTPGAAEGSDDLLTGTSKQSCVAWFLCTRSNGRAGVGQARRIWFKEGLRCDGA